MKLIEINWHPSTRALRQFGFLALVFMPLLGWLWGASLFGLCIWAACGLTLGVLALIRPQLLRPVFVLLCLLTLPIGMVVGEVVMFLSFFLVFVLFALLFRLLGRDSLQRTLQPHATTYWQPKAQAADPVSYFRQS